MADRVDRLVIRPFRMRILAFIAAGAVMVSAIWIGMRLADEETYNVPFRLADQIALIGLGTLLAIAILLTARPSIVADATGVRVRNMMSTKHFDWQIIYRAAYPKGAPWAQLILADDESYPMMAIQDMDRARAVASMTALRAMLDTHAPNRPEPSPQSKAAHEAAALRAQMDRPRGRLESGGQPGAPTD